jgi:uncharacterized membrane protein
VDKAITIERPVVEVYQFWRRFENLPRFMRHLESVTIQDELHSHWVAKSVGGKLLEWDSEIIEQRENQMISWRSAPAADVDNAGSVWFTAVPNGQGTLLRLEMKYVPPAGKTGALIAKAFGRDADTEIEEDLQRLKSLLETGRIPEEVETPRFKWASGAARKAAEMTAGCVRDNPWSVVGTAAVAGFALGLIIGYSRISETRRPMKRRARD